MIRGTTPTHVFTLPFDVSVIKTAKVIYSQRGEVVLTKCGDDLRMEGNEIRLTLSQENTLSFTCTDNVSIQLRVLTTANDALASDIMIISVARCLEDEVLT